MNTTTDDKQYWFPAKRFGWGWGLPTVWQGWFVLGAFVLSMFALPLIFDPGAQLAIYVTSVSGVTFVLIAICYIKGEPLTRNDSGR